MAQMGERAAPDDDRRSRLGNWRRIFERSLTPMVIFDGERRILDANPAACLLLRASRSVLTTLRFDDLTPAQELGRLGRLFADFVEQGSQAGQYTLRVHGQDLEVEYAATANIVPGQHLTVFFLWRRAQDEEAGDAGAPAGQPPLGEPGEEARLSIREREVLTLLALGDDGEQIASQLRISPATVRTHIQNARQKLGATTRTHAIALALRDGEITMGPGRPLLP